MKKILSVIFAVGVLLFAGNLFAQESRVSVKAKSFARAWEELNLERIRRNLSMSAKGELTGFFFSDTLDDETFKARRELISLLQSMNSSEIEKFKSCFSAFSSTMKVRKSLSNAVVTVSDAKGNAKYIICLIQTNKKNRISNLELFICSNDAEFKRDLKIVDKKFVTIECEEENSGEDVELDKFLK